MERYMNMVTYSLSQVRSLTQICEVACRLDSACLKLSVIKSFPVAWKQVGANYNGHIRTLDVLQRA